ncbi:uncharacterized protein HKW66_Vig0258610 [Vigna angularis]|uniref:TLDc domain-containing protein n=1 Tax=Phaseolus angularis TaxID=3914 RepID=A0A8T0KRZ6_PHAAN|nr:uncharacterized protein HKW66_Vig0258610 [Vigna angularis]
MHSFRDKVTQKFSYLFPNSSSSQDSPYSQEDKPVSSYLSYIIPSISFDGSNTSKYQNENKSPSAGYNYENFDYQDVPSDNYVDCSPVYNNMDSVKDSNDNNNNEDHTSRRSSSSSEVFEEANEQQPQASKKSRLNLSDESTFISPELYEFLEICLPNIVKGRQWVLLYSTLKHGVSLRTLIRKSSELSCPGLLIVGDMQGAIFGGLLECPLKPTAKRKYQGTSETFVFTTVYGQPRLFLPTAEHKQGENSARRLSSMENSTRRLSIEDNLTRQLSSVERLTRHPNKSMMHSDSPVRCIEYSDSLVGSPDSLMARTCTKMSLLSKGVNRYYCMCMNDLLALGGGGSYALCLEEDLLSGTSGPSETFGNSCLAHSPEFQLKNVECALSTSQPHENEDNAHNCGVLHMLPLFKAKMLLFDVQKKRLSLLPFFSVWM